MIRSKGYCESCLENGESVRLEAAHICGRTYRTTRWGCIIDGKYDSNGICLCTACHQQYDRHIAKEKFIREVVIGLKRYDKLLTAKQAIAKHQDFQEIKVWIESNISRET